MCTTVPLGNVRWAHVPGGAASYQLAPPVWEFPAGAGAGVGRGPAADVGVDLGVAAGRAAGRLVVVARRGAVVVTCRGAARYRVGLYGGRAAVVVVGATVVVGASVVSGTSDRLARSAVALASAASSPAISETGRAEATAWGVAGGPDAWVRARTGTAAMARHSIDATSSCRAPTR